jgi:hypothetical protein
VACYGELSSQTSKEKVWKKHSRNRNTSVNQTGRSWQINSASKIHRYAAMFLIIPNIIQIVY